MGSDATGEVDTALAAAAALGGIVVLASLAGFVLTATIPAVVCAENRCIAGFVAGGMLFTITSVGSLRIAGHRHRGEQVALGLYGLMFPIWGPLLGALGLIVAGPLGIPHAAVTAILLRSVVRSSVVSLAPLWALLPAWGIAWLLVQYRSAAMNSATTGLFMPMATLAVYLWNAVIAAALCGWAVLARRAGEFGAPPNRCGGCGYDITGLPGEVCPECGGRLPQLTATLPAST